MHHAPVQLSVTDVNDAFITDGVTFTQWRCVHIGLWCMSAWPAKALTLALTHKGVDLGIYLQRRFKRQAWNRLHKISRWMIRNFRNVNWRVTLGRGRSNTLLMVFVSGHRALQWSTWMLRLLALSTDGIQRTDRLVRYLVVVFLASHQRCVYRHPLDARAKPYSRVHVFEWLFFEWRCDPVLKIIGSDYRPTLHPCPLRFCQYKTNIAGFFASKYVSVNTFQFLWLKHHNRQNLSLLYFILYPFRRKDNEYNSKYDNNDDGFPDPYFMMTSATDCIPVQGGFFSNETGGVLREWAFHARNIDDSGVI